MVVSVQLRRRDLLGECNLDGAPLDMFQQECCARCLNQECTRSIAGKSKFEQRTSTWEERLFSQVPRMDPTDPRYVVIAGQRFITVDVGRTPEVRSDWVDPLVPTPAPAVTPVQVAAQPVVITQKTEELSAPSARTDGFRTKPNMVLSNAPDQSGKVLKPNAPLPTQAPKDAWSPQKSASEGVVLPGAVIKLGV